MNLSKQTLETLKNWTQFNEGIVLKPGKNQSTLGTSNSIYAEAVFSEEIPVQAPIHKLPQLLAAANQLNSPDFEFKDKYVILSDSDYSIKYYYSDAEAIHQLPEGKSLDLDNVDVEFELTGEVFTKLMRLTATLSLPNLVVHGDDTGLYVKGYDVANDASSFLERKISELEFETPFDAIFTIENLLMIPDDYYIRLELGKFAIFESKKNNRKYTVAIKKLKRK